MNPSSSKSGTTSTEIMQMHFNGQMMVSLTQNHVERWLVCSLSRYDHAAGKLTCIFLRNPANRHFSVTRINFHLLAPPIRKAPNPHECCIYFCLFHF